MDLRPAATLENQNGPSVHDLGAGKLMCPKVF